MRLIRNIFILILSVLLVAMLYRFLEPVVRQIVLQEKIELHSDMQREAAVKLAYRLDQKKWLTYPLMTGEDIVRVMSNVILDKNYQVGEEDRFLYSIKFEVLDDAGKVVDAGEFYHQGGQKIYEDSVSGEHYTSTHIYLDQANPVDSRIHLINLRGLKNARKIRFIKGRLEAPALDIAMSAYQKKKISSRKLDYAWQRMGEERRQKLAKVSVYGSSIINESEQLQLLKNQWAPLGPLGVADEDYTVQKLYIVRDVENDVVINVPPVPSTGLVIYPDRYGMLTLPEMHSNIKISWLLFDGTATSSAKDSVSIEWWGRPATKYKKWNQLISNGEFIKTLDNGVVRISSQQPIVVRVWKQLTQQERKNSADNKDKLYTEITPKPAYLRLYNSLDFDLTYKVNHIRGYKTPMRFDIRAIDEIAVPDISYRFLDKKNRVLKNGKINLQQSLSAYDSVVSDNGQWLTDPQRVYLNLPRQVSKISFDAPAGVWISAYSRPKNLAYLHIDPMSEEQRKQAVPIWFSIRPEQWKNYMLKGRSKLITVQRRPPEIDQQLLAGMYRWDQFYPQGSWKGRSLLTPQENVQIKRDEALASRFVELKNAQSLRLSFIAKEATESVRPTLVYARKTIDPLNVNVWVNEKLILQDTVYAKNGEIQLPYLKEGEAKVRIEGVGKDNQPVNELTFYINNVLLVSEDSVQPNTMLKRLAIKLPESTLSFNVFKEKSNELLAMRLYIPETNRKNISLNVKVRGLDSRGTGPFKDWTLVYRKYDIRELDSSAFDVNQQANVMPVMLNTKQQVKKARLFFIPLGSDMKNNQTYKVDIKLSEGDGAYIVLTRTIPGLYPSLQLYPDVEVESANE